MNRSAKPLAPVVVDEAHRPVAVSAIREGWDFPARCFVVGLPTATPSRSAQWCGRVRSGMSRP